MGSTAKNSAISCHVHDSVEFWEVEEIRKSVCSEVLSATAVNGKNYCLLHLPIQDKNEAEFNNIVFGRLGEIRKTILEYRISDGTDRDKPPNLTAWDLRYVYFPRRVDFSTSQYEMALKFRGARFCEGITCHGTTFEESVDWDHAIFEAYAEFRKSRFQAGGSFNDAKFAGNAIFIDSRFLGYAGFSSVNFEKGADFRHARFLCDVQFYSARFADTAYFGSARFQEEVNFVEASFDSSASFSRTQFAKHKDTNLSYSTFLGDSFFDRTRFRGPLSFNSAVFGEDSDLMFRRAFFNATVDFSYCTSEGYLRFSNPRQGRGNRFDFEESAFEKATRVSFHTLDLAPNWFVNADPRKFVFTDILWRNLYWDRQLRKWRTQVGNQNILRELNALKQRGIDNQGKRLFEIAARQLAVNCEENNRYDDAARFRYMAMETRRLEDRQYPRISRLLTWLYKWTSGYGEKWAWALLVLVSVWLFFGMLYWQFGSFATDQPLTFSQSLGYSSSVMLLQKPDPVPISNLTYTLRIVETIIAPIQAALLALAIRRKFMR
jgi:hypothetical protein